MPRNNNKQAKIEKVHFLVDRLNVDDTCTSSSRLLELLNQSQDLFVVCPHDLPDLGAVLEEVECRHGGDAGDAGGLLRNS